MLSNLRRCLLEQHSRDSLREFVWHRMPSVCHIGFPNLNQEVSPSNPLQTPLQTPASHDALLSFQPTTCSSGLS